MKPPGDRRFESLVPFTRLLYWVPILDPQPNSGHVSKGQNCHSADVEECVMLAENDC